jgi:hypothetical protein
MENSRDSSIWRSLAVAFGDGLAFGVGVKLTQSAARQAGAPLQPDISPIAGRLGQIEQRIERIERAPAAVSAAPAGPAPAGFDQKVLEAVVHALDARLHEQAGQVESRLTELEARIAIEFQSLHQEDRALRAEVADKSREIAELRERQAESDRNVLDLILAIGQMCREAAERIADPAARPAPAEPRAEPAPPAAEIPEEQVLAGAPDAPPFESPVPGFAQPKPPARLWRVPLVSSFLLTAVGVLLLQYL